MCFELRAGDMLDSELPMSPAKFCRHISRSVYAKFPNNPKIANEYFWFCVLQRAELLRRDSEQKYLFYLGKKYCPVHREHVCIRPNTVRREGNVTIQTLDGIWEYRHRYKKGIEKKNV